MREEIKPVRLQLSRKKGFKLESPNGLPIVIVDRRNKKYGNPFIVGVDGDQKQCVLQFKVAAYNTPDFLSEVRRELRDKNLACWCKIWDEKGLRVPCHADVLLKLANA